MKKIGRLNLNRYVWEIYRDTKEIVGLKRYLYLCVSGVTTLARHKFNLWDYMDELERNDYILKMKNGIKFYLPYCRYSDFIQMVITRNCDFYDADTLRYLRDKYISSGENILDIGANIGNHSVFFATECGANHVFSFEPQKDVFEILNKNISLNGLQDVCTTYNMALGAGKGNAKIASYNRNNCGGTSFAMDNGGNVTVISVDEMDFPEIGFVKIDVEGFEYDVLKGAERFLRNMNPVIYIEIKEENFNKVNGLMNSYGYAMIENINEDYIYKK